MIKLYRGQIIEEAESSCLFMLDSAGPKQILKQLIEKQSTPNLLLDFSLLNKKYHFIIQTESIEELPVLILLERLEKIFPQIIWTKVIKKEQGEYKLEFIPIPFSPQQQSEDGSLADCLEEMGYHANNLIPSFRDKVLNLFNEFKTPKATEVQINEYVNYSPENKVSKESVKEAATSTSHSVMDNDAILQRLRTIQQELKTKEVNSQEDIKDDLLLTVKEKDRLEKSIKLKRKKNTKNQEHKIKKKKYIFGGSIGLLTLSVLLGSQFYTMRIVEGESMAPTLNSNEILFIDKKISQVSRNDMISFEVPELANKEFVKRVIGLPGDRIYASGGDVYVNSRKIDAKYATHSTKDFDLKELSGRETVPEGKIFVLGDNREHSTDSRNFGFVEEEQIKGKVIFK